MCIMERKNRKQKLLDVVSNFSDGLVITTNDLKEDGNIKLKYAAKSTGLVCMMFVKRMLHKHFLKPRSKNEKIQYTDNHVYLVSQHKESYNYLAFIKLSGSYHFRVIGAIVEGVFYEDYHFATLCNYNKSIFSICIIRAMLMYLPKIIHTLVCSREKCIKL